MCTVSKEEKTIILHSHIYEKKTNFKLNLKHVLLFVLFLFHSKFYFSSRQAPKQRVCLLFSIAVKQSTFKFLLENATNRF